MKILSIVGSENRASVSAALLRVALAAVHDPIEMVPAPPLTSLPHFAAGLEGEDVPDVVRRFRALVSSADGVLIATPEYAHSLPGLLKNGLDWLVESGDLVNKPVAIMSASPALTGGLRAIVALTQTLLAQSAVVVALLPVGAVKAKISASGEISDASAIRRVRETLRALIETCDAVSKMQAE